MVGINGAAAHLVRPDDKVIIMAYGMFAPEELADYHARVVHVDDSNRIRAIGNNPSEAIAEGLSSPPHAVSP